MQTQISLNILVLINIFLLNVLFDVSPLYLMLLYVLFCYFLLSLCCFYQA